MNYNLNIREVTYALSEALDLVGIDDILHGKRVAYMAAEVAKELDWDKNKYLECSMIVVFHQHMSIRISSMNLIGIILTHMQLLVKNS